MSTITLISGDEVSFTLSREAAKQSRLLRLLMQDEEDTTEVRLAEATSSALGKIVEWCQYHEHEMRSQLAELNLIPYPRSRNTTELSEWEQAFYKVDQELLFEIILASHLLEISPIVDSGCKTIANMIKGKDTEEIRRIFNIQNDFTPEEEEQIRLENEWAEEVDCLQEPERISLRTGSTITVKALEPKKEKERSYKRVYKKMRRLLDHEMITATKV